MSEAMSGREGIGIDFGTTNSVVARAIRGSGRAPVQSFALGGEDGRPHPSVIWYRPNGETQVGRIAKHNLLGRSGVPGNHFASSVKRKLGTGESIEVFGQKYGAVAVAAEIFSHLKRDAEARHEARHGVALNEAIVTIPVKFDGRARSELREAADRAGIYIKMFVHEPFAAVVGYCYTNEPFRGLDERDGQTILVFDWGGGTLDITVGRVEGGGLVELGTEGLNDRSGDHFDKLLSNHVKTEFVRRHRIPADQMTPGRGTADRLRAECEQCKIELSGAEVSVVNVAQFLPHGSDFRDLNAAVFRGEFEDIIRNDVREAVALVDRVLEQSGVRDSDIDLALLIGGSSRIPMVRNQLFDRFGTKMVQVANADTIIAEGAAIVDQLGLQTALARSILIELSDGTTHGVFDAGAVAKPDFCRKDVALYCTDNRDGQARLVIKEGPGNRAGTARTMAVLPIPVCPKLPEPYDHERVKAEFKLDCDLVLKVEARGAIDPRGATTDLFDLRFALKAYGDGDGIQPGGAVQPDAR